MKKTQVEGMKQKPAGGVERKPFGQNLQPTNAGRMSRLTPMLNAIKHAGRVVSGSKMPFSK